MKNFLTLFAFAITFGVFAQVPVTIQVDMTGQTVSANGVHIVGNFNGWNTSSDMLNSIGSNIYSITLDLIPGQDYEYKFINGNAWGNEEAAPGLCTIGSNNRIFTAPSNATTLSVVPFNGCPAVVATQSVTFNVDMTGQTVSANGVHVVGNFNAWNTSGTQLSNTGGNIYSTTVNVLSSLSVLQYKFINGNAWGMEETPGAGCGNSGNNRTYILDGAGNSVTLPTASFDACSNPLPMRSLTFSVQLNGIIPSANGIHLIGNFQGWTPGASPMALINNGIYYVTLDVLTTERFIEYKFMNGNAWGAEEIVPQNCNFNTNRYKILDLNSPAQITLETFVFGTCIDAQNTVESRPQISIEDGDIHIENSSYGAILTSPNGNCFRITVDDNGTIQSTAVVCP